MFARRKSLLSFSALVIVAAFAATKTSAAPPTPTTTTLTINPNPVAVGDPSPTITATSVITSSGVLVTEGGLTLDKLVLVGSHYICAATLLHAGRRSQRLIPCSVTASVRTTPSMEPSSILRQTPLWQASTATDALCARGWHGPRAESVGVLQP